METWGVLVWNMARGAKARCKAADTWAYLARLIEDHHVEVALLNEADVYSLKAMNTAAARDGRPEPAVFSMQGTLGRDFWDKDGIRTPFDRSRWSAAVMSRTGPRLLDEDDVRAVATSWPYRSPDIPFTNSRPGSWIAASVAVGSETVTCISLYGLIEELSDASMHRSLSEISPLFSDPRHNELVLLGGDFNTGTATEAEYRERDRIVLDRIAAYGLHDCLAEWREKNHLPVLEDCPCSDDPCRHTMTRLTPNLRGQDLPWQKRVSKQVDYLFASESLANRLHEVIEIQPDEWEAYSDHRPIIATLKAE